MRYKLGNGVITAVIDDLGAEPVSLIFQGRERLWQNKNGSWAGHAPVLFPVCGNCGLFWDGTRYPLPRHGFARRSRFALAGQTENSLSFVLRSDEDTLKQFPFAFLFTVTYRLDGNSLFICYEAENPSEKPLYFSWGGHLSHALFAPISEYGLCFEEEESFLAFVHDGEGRLTGERKFYGEGRELPLPEERLQHGNTLIFAPRSRAVTLHRAKKPLARLEFEGFPYLLLWRPEGADMICVEPWGNLPDGAGEETAFSQKAGIRTLAGGERGKAVQKITYFEG